jgi:hypothetical protein
VRKKKAHTKKRISVSPLPHPTVNRTQQLRVAMKALGAPVLGDPLYGGGGGNRSSGGSSSGGGGGGGITDALVPPAPVIDRAYLHAAAVRLRVGGELFQVCRLWGSGLCVVARVGYFGGGGGAAHSSPHPHPSTLQNKAPPNKKNRPKNP